MTDVIDQTILTITVTLCVVLLGFAGLIGVLVAAAFALAPHIGAAWASLAVGLSAMLLAFQITLLLKWRTSRGTDHHTSEKEPLDFLSDFPLDLAKQLIVDKPATSLGAAFIAGYTATKDPSSAFEQARQFLDATSTG